MPRAHLKRGTSLILQNCQRKTCRDFGVVAVERTTVLWLGHPNGWGVGGSLQPDVVSQWLGVATRQCLDRPGSIALRLSEQNLSDPRSTVPCEPRRGTATPSRIVLRLS